MTSSSSRPDYEREFQSSTGDSLVEKEEVKKREDERNGRDSTSREGVCAKLGGEADCLNMDQADEYPLGDCHSQ